MRAAPLHGTPADSHGAIIRGYQPGDVGYIIYLHGKIYREICGFDRTFEGFVAQGLGQFLVHFDPSREYLWIVETDAEIAGSVGVSRVDDETAQLRWLLLHPRVWGQGIGRDLVQRVIDFSREKGYRRVILHTVQQLTAARNLYRSFGFQVFKSFSHCPWGVPVTEEHWELIL